MKTSPKTTIFGILTIIVAIGGAIKLLIDDDPSTNPDWTFVVGQILVGIGLIFGKDYNITGTGK